MALELKVAPKVIQEGVQTLPLPQVTVSPSAQIPIENTIVLELALYENYNYRGTMYTKGTGYRFKREDAITLLNERDADRPIWRQFRVPRKVVSNEPVVVDETNRKMDYVDEDLPGSAVPETRKTKIEVGSDAEIADILSRTDPADEVVI